MKSKVHPRYKTKYRVANWAAYNQALVRRGDVTGRCCMKTLRGGRTSRDPPQGPHYRDEVEGPSPSWLLRSSATDAACLRRPSVVVVEPAQHREGHDAPAGLYAARPLPLVRDPLPDPLVRSPPVEVSHPFGEHAA